MEFRIKSLSELRHFAEKLQKNSPKGAIFALIGELGAGKTAFTKLFLKAAGIRHKVSSPTFVLMVHHKKGPANYYHLDLYRTKSFREVRAIGITEHWGKKENIFLIEWAGKIKRHLPKKTIYLKLKIIAGHSGQRTIQLLNAPKKLENVLK